jgi:hypothetical protein
MMYGDEETGYSLAFIFKVPDSQARGFQRRLSLIVLDHQLARLSASWQFLSLYVASM